MEALRKISEKVNQLVGEANSILAKKDQIFATLQRATGRADETTSGWMTDEETADSYRLAREITGDYAAWYPPAWHLVSANLPERRGEFESLYEGCRSQSVEIMGADGQLRRGPLVLFEKCFCAQAGFVRSIPAAIESRALALRGILARDLMDDELAACDHLLRNGYVREAGTIAGVVLEHHLKLMCEKRGLPVEDKDTLGALNAKLRQHYPDDSEFRRVQWMSEIRAACAHEKSSPPERRRVEELISTVRDFVTAIS